MTQPVYSDEQKKAHTDVGVTAPMPVSTPVEPTPTNEGTVGPPAISEFPWAGRFAAGEAAFDGSAAAFGALAAQAQAAPGTAVTSSLTVSAPNTEPM